MGWQRLSPNQEAQIAKNSRAKYTLETKPAMDPAVRDQSRVGKWTGSGTVQDLGGVWDPGPFSQLLTVQEGSPWPTLHYWSQGLCTYQSIGLGPFPL